MASQREERASRASPKERVQWHAGSFFRPYRKGGGKGKKTGKSGSAAKANVAEEEVEEEEIARLLGCLLASIKDKLSKSYARPNDPRSDNKWDQARWLGILFINIKFANKGNWQDHNAKPHDTLPDNKGDLGR